MDALAHLGPAVADLHFTVFGEADNRLDYLEKAVPEPGVLEPEAETYSLAVEDGLVISAFDGLQASPGTE